MKNIKLNQEVIIERMHPRQCEDTIIKAYINKIGKKYVDVCRCDTSYPFGKFNIETGEHFNGNYSPEFKIYFSQQEFNEEKEKILKINFINNNISKKLDIEIIRKIYNLLN